MVSPASWPEGPIDREIALLELWGLTVEVAKHVHTRHGYMAGSDAQRLEDLNSAIRDPAVRAVITTRGGAGAYRIADGIDTDALRADPKPIVGFSDITHLHLEWWRRAGVPSIHGCLVGARAAETARQLLLTTEPLTVTSDPALFGAQLRTTGSHVAPLRGRLVGGNLSAIAHQVGVALPSLAGGILLIEDERRIGIGRVDRQLTQLRKSGALEGLVGLAVGRLSGFEDYEDRGWTILDVLDDHVAALGVPVLGGLPIGHGGDQCCVPLGAMAELRPASGTLVCASPNTPESAL